MKANWPSVPLGELLTRRKDEVAVQPMEFYSRLTIRMNGRGIVVRDRVQGHQIGTKNQFVAKAGQLVLSKIDARNGAFGVLPDACDGAIITGNFWAFDPNLDRLDVRYLNYLTKTPMFIDFCIRASDGTTNRLYLQEPKFLAREIPLPPVTEQRRIVARIEQLAAQIEEARLLKGEIATDQQRLLQAAFARIVEGASYRPMRDVSPIVRRPAELDSTTVYPELGIRSFGRGTFHKPALTGFELGSKRLYRFESGDLVFMNVFAWEGAVAVAKPEDAGRFGSHRFITCVAKLDVVTAGFLCFYFLTDEGLEKLRDASPGGAGRNRTLGLNALGNIEVPAPPMEKQLWFDGLAGQVAALARLQSESHLRLEQLLPSVLHRAFSGEL